MADFLNTLKRETLVEYIRQRCFLRKELHRDLLFIEWDLQAKAAQKMMDDACERMNRAETREELLAAQKDWEKGNRAYEKADRIYAKMEALK